jgi:hypothetical protein
MVYKYYYGETSDYEESKVLLGAKLKAMILLILIAIKGGKKISIQDAIK